VDKDTLKGLFLDSLARLPTPFRQRVEIVLAGYWRISRTEELIQRVLDGELCDEDDRDYWTMGLEDERGHADAYRLDLRDWYGQQMAERLISAYQPCPGMYWLLTEGIGDCPYTLGIYRTYLELGLISMPPEALKEAREWLPRTMAIHEAADPGHADAGLDYLLRYHWENPAVEIEMVEKMLIAEINHRGVR